MAIHPCCQGLRLVIHMLVREALIDYQRQHPGGHIHNRRITRNTRVARERLPVDGQTDTGVSQRVTQLVSLGDVDIHRQAQGRDSLG